MDMKGKTTGSRQCERGGAERGGALTRTQSLFSCFLARRRLDTRVD